MADNRTQEGKRLNRRIEAVIECATDVAGLTVKSERMTMALLIEFDQNSADIRPQYRNDLSEVADFLKANPAVTATVEGHTGNLQATPALAMEISQHRAQNVVNTWWTFWHRPLTPHRGRVRPVPAGRLQHHRRGAAGKPQGQHHHQLPPINERFYGLSLPGFGSALVMQNSASSSSFMGRAMK